MTLPMLEIASHDTGLLLRPALSAADACVPQSIADLAGNAIFKTAEAANNAVGALMTSPGLALVVAAFGTLGLTLLWQSRSYLLASMSWLRATPPGASAPGMQRNAKHEQALADELAAALALIRNHMMANRGYAKSLVDSKLSLAEATQPEQVRLIVEFMIDENQRIMQEAGKLENGLEQSRRQIEQLQVTLAAAEEIGTRDSLTSVANRRQFDKVLSASMATAEKDNSALCLVLADIDHFKAVNDKHGHVAGDNVLKSLAELLTKNVKGRDTVARYGGEEFAIILPQTSIGDAYQVGEQIRSRLEAAHWSVAGTGGPLGKITASFGIAQLRDGDTPVTMIERADANLYESKRQGRNRITLDSSAKVYLRRDSSNVSLVQA